MFIQYQCRNCAKRFKIKDYMQLELVCTQGECAIGSIPTGRKCNSCGNEIGKDDKIIEN